MSKHIRGWKERLLSKGLESTNKNSCPSNPNQLHGLLQNSTISMEKPIIHDELLLMGESN